MCKSTYLPPEELIIKPEIGKSQPTFRVPSKPQWFGILSG